MNVHWNDTSPPPPPECCCSNSIILRITICSNQSWKEIIDIPSTKYNVVQKSILKKCQIDGNTISTTTTTVDFILATMYHFLIHQCLLLTTAFTALLRTTIRTTTTTTTTTTTGTRTRRRAKASHERLFRLYFHFFFFSTVVGYLHHVDAFHSVECLRFRFQSQQNQRHHQLCFLTNLLPARFTSYEFTDSTLTGRTTKNNPTTTYESQVSSSKLTFSFRPLFLSLRSQSVSPVCFSSTFLSSSASTNSEVSSLQPQEDYERESFSYDRLTVKELRQLVKNQPGIERGMISKLVRKQDLIDFLLSLSKYEPGKLSKHASQESLSTTSDTEITSSSKPMPSTVQTNSTSTLTSVPVRINSKTQKTVQVDQNRRARMPMQLPPLSLYQQQLLQSNSNNKNGVSSDALLGVSSTSKASMTPKDLILEEVYNRYPPLRPQLQNDKNSLDSSSLDSLWCSSADEGYVDTTDQKSKSGIDNDLRQLYHPIFHNLRRNNATGLADSEDDDSSESAASSSASIMSSSDMDIIFVGTASCTPGVTRGTSCTAVRLNWKRPTFSSVMRNGNSNEGGRRGMQKNEKQSKQQQQQRQVQNFNSKMNNGISGTWLFDVGECTQLQIQRTTSIKPSKITKIFLTHAHGDHSFGLPGLLCIMGSGVNRDPDQPVIEIYGPEGVRMWLRVAIRYSVSRIVPPYVVHELMDIPMAPEWEFNYRHKRYYYNGFNSNQLGSTDGTLDYKRRWGSKGLSGEDPSNWISQANCLQLQPSELYGEVEGGRSIYPVYNHPKSYDGAPIWTVIDESDLVKVYAAPMSHSIPCVGYCIEEQPRPGRLRNDIVEPIVHRNVDALKKVGFVAPLKVMGILKNLKENEVFTFPDGTVLSHNDVVEPRRAGRKIVICGDTADSRAMTTLAANADVIVHEATNAYLPGVETKKDVNYRDVTRDCIIHGHSTPQMAGEFCKFVNGKRLLLNHFSARYKGDISADSISIMMRIEKQAMKASGLNETQVAAAWDFMVLPIPQL